MNTQDREEIERHFAMRFAADLRKNQVEYETVIEDAPVGMWSTPTRYLWFDVVGDGVFTKSLFKTLQKDVSDEGVLPYVIDGVTTGRARWFGGGIVSIGFSFAA